jgi:hypothetical protein
LHALTNVARADRTYTFVADFAQNMYVPNFAAEQPGATYYFSPLNVYPFGVVDASTSPTLLTAFIYSEGTREIELLRWCLLLLLLSNLDAHFWFVRLMM